MLVRKDTKEIISQNDFAFKNGRWYGDGEIVEDPNREFEISESGKTPQSVEAWKAREMLEVMGLTTQIETTLSALDPLVAARYKAFTVFERNDALIVMFASQLGFTDAQTDSMFIVANQITSASTRADIEALLRAEGHMA